MGADSTRLDDGGASALAMLARFHGVPADPAVLAREFGNEGAFDHFAAQRAAKRLGLKVRARRWDPRRAARQPLPALLRRRDGSWTILAKVVNDQALVQDPGGDPGLVALSALEGEHLILVARRDALMGSQGRFGLTWFVPAIIKYRATLIQVLVVSVLLQIFALITPLFFQVVVDKVLVHQGIATLTVVSLGLLLAIVFESVLGWLRTYLLSHTTSRIDVELGAKLYQHLLALPLAYFQNRPTGQTVARVRELEHVREFITGSALTVLIDGAFGLAFFIVMWLYSPILTIVVALSLPIYVAISLLIGPALRRQVEELFQRGAVRESFLVESVAGAETVKAMALEPQMRYRWETQLAAFVSQSFRTVMTGTTGMKLIETTSKVVTAVIIWVGAYEVMGQRLTVGELVAFNMLAGQISGPILRLSQLWQQFQQMRISLNRLGDILDTPVEPGSGRVAPSPPALAGRIEFEHVGFRYRLEGSDILDDITVAIAPGTLVGIVGRSGSGKSTLSRLIQRLYVPGRGKVLIDGYDLAIADPAWLRRQVGVVLQDTLLFNRTVRENISLADPSLSMERVVEAAELAGAHEFIASLPEAYDTSIEERGTNLSGGQRQRLAIARTLAADPRILILDEATSALDADSESAFLARMPRIRAGRTVLVIAHRLSTIMGCDRILVMDKGRIVEDGTPAALIAADGPFANLVRKQSTAVL